MKILHVVPSMFKAGGGTSEVVPRMCEALADAGHDVRIVAGKARSCESDAALRAANKGVDIRYCKIHRIPKVSFMRVTSEFRNEIEEGVKWADVVHVHSHWENSSWVTPKLARLYKKPYVMQSHGFLEPERLKHSRIAKMIIGKLFELPNLNEADAIIATADSERESIVKFGVRAPIKIVPIGFDFDDIGKAVRSDRLLQSLGLDLDKRTLLFFSRISPIKGLDLLAKAWGMLEKFHDKWQLCITGPDDRGYERIIKQAYANEICNKSVIFTGPIYGEDKFNLLKSVDAFILPTKNENFSIAVQEALAAGLPTVCTKGAPWRVIETYGAGYWVDVCVDGIAEGIRKVFESNDDTLEKMSKAGVRLVKDEFAWEAMTDRLVCIYKSIITGEV